MSGLALYRFRGARKWVSSVNVRAQARKWASADPCLYPSEPGVVGRKGGRCFLRLNGDSPNAADGHLIRLHYASERRGLQTENSLSSSSPNTHADVQTLENGLGKRQVGTEERRTVIMGRSPRNALLFVRKQLVSFSFFKFFKVCFLLFLIALVNFILC